MFTKTAKFYDAVYSYKDYVAESQLITSMVGGRVSGAKTLLDVACGTGKHLEHLVKQFDCTGVDLDPEMLEIASVIAGGCEPVAPELFCQILGSHIDFGAIIPPPHQLVRGEITQVLL